MPSEPAWVISWRGVHLSAKSHIPGSSVSSMIGWSAGKYPVAARGNCSTSNAIVTPVQVVYWAATPFGSGSCRP